MDVEEPLDKKDVADPLNMTVLSVGDTSGSNPDNDDSERNTSAEDLDPSEKLSLDRSSEDDFMEDAALDIKQNKSNESETIDYVEKFGTFVQKEENSIDKVGDGKLVETEIVKADQKTVSALSSSKRKFYKEVDVNNDTAKRAHRWKAEEGPKSHEPQSGTTVASVVRDDSSQLTSKRFSRSNSLVNEEPKELVVPQLSKPPTNQN